MEPLELYEKIQPMIQKEIESKIEAFSSARKYDIAQIPIHAHTGVDSSKVDFDNLEDIRRYILFRIVNATTDTAVANVVGGDFVMPLSGYIVSVGATVDTAGTTGTTTVDINKNGITILLTKITIDSTEKTSRTAATPFVLNTSTKTFLEGDIFTFDVDAINTTAAKGLTIFMDIIES